MATAKLNPQQFGIEPTTTATLQRQPCKTREFNHPNRDVKRQCVEMNQCGHNLITNTAKETCKETISFGFDFLSCLYIDAT